MRPAELRELARTRALLLDGGLGSMLIAGGLDEGRAPEWWNLEHPERIEAVHRAYLEAGSDVVHTNTFGANPLRLAAGGLAGRCHEVNAAAVEITRRATRGTGLIAGDMGPTGHMLPPLGTTTVEQLYEAFREQAEALAQAGADLISIETMSDLREARAAVEAARATSLAVHASMTFERRRRGFFTIMGDPLVPSLIALAEAGADAVGCNCSVTSAVMVAMVSEAAALVPVPFSAQPNAGQPHVTAEGVVYDASPEAFAGDLAAMVHAGASLVGGCCGTTPEFIRQARTALDATVRQ
ncbi:MAG: homocysteine S-methyltransferase family protein [Acidobacteriia bacterium]|nr:homocysteine S-methyltransferase family protein [Terriglobia bacterium]